MNNFNDFLNENISDNDCNKYFNFKDLKKYYNGYENPIYYLVRKRTIEKLEYISPKDYLDIVCKNMKISYDKMLNTVINNNLVIEYAQKMLNGEKFPICYYTVNSSLQEGRHRALALIEINCNMMPVIKIITNVSDNLISKKLEIFEKYIDNDNGRKFVDDYYKIIGYEGITDLDWRTLIEYFKY